MVENHYRWDFIGLSSQSKPTPATSEKVVNGSTFYEGDTSKLYVFCEGTWYEKTATGGGGGTSDFNSLTNRPKYNGVTMSSTTNIPEVVTYSNFTGTDGTSAGAAGLVPAPATTDAGKFLKADGTWDTAGGGSSVTVVQTPGTSSTDVMSQNATTSMIFSDPSTMYKIKIGAGTASNEGSHAIEIGQNSSATGGSSTCLGYKTTASSSSSLAIGTNAKCNHSYSVALGAKATTSVQGEVNIGLTDSDGYNNSLYRIISGVYDGQSDHDAATVGQIKMGILSAAPTGATAGMPGRLYTFDNGGTYDVYLCVHDNGDNTYVWKQLSLI